ncbi:MAG: type II secretion system F family protein [Acidimicrobiales bacterium]|nr:type II secretion system F family protein [Acidimicrobiales bacterium]
MPLYVYVAALLVALAVAVGIAALATSLADRQPSSLGSRAGSNLKRGRPQTSRQVVLNESARARLADPLFEAIARRARRFSSAEGVGRTEQKLTLAGLTDAGWTVERMLVVRVLSAGTALGISTLLLGASPERNSVLQALLVVVAAALGPNAWLNRKVQERQDALAELLPDMIDQLSVNIEAGLGFDTAMMKATEGETNPLSEEFRRVLQDVQMGATREQAFEQLVERTDVPELRQFVSAVRQSTEHGIPISRVLQVQSKEIRQKQQGRIEEKAASLPVKIVFPLVFCILPSLFVIILGPAALDLAGGF